MLSTLYPVFAEEQCSKPIIQVEINTNKLEYNHLNIEWTAFIKGNKDIMYIFYYYMMGIRPIYVRVPGWFYHQSMHAVTSYLSEYIPQWRKDVRLPIRISWLKKMINKQELYCNASQFFILTLTAIMIYKTNVSWKIEIT